MKTSIMRVVGLVFCLNAAEFSTIYAATCSHSEVVNTDAGHIDFTFVNYVKHSIAYQKIRHISTEDKAVDLENGSRWSISKADTVRGWESSKSVVVTQNHASFSTARYALLNPELKLAVPASLIREPAPKDALYIASIDRVNDMVILSDNKKWIIHADDRSNLSKMQDHDRIIVGVNTSHDQDKSPYLLIDTSNHHFVRAHNIE